MSQEVAASIKLYIEQINSEIDFVSQQYHERLFNRQRYLSALSILNAKLLAYKNCLELVEKAQENQDD